MWTPARRALAFTVTALACLTAATLAEPAPAQAASVTVHMSPSGSDSADGGSATPVKSLKRVKALLTASSATTATIVVRAGTYYETATVAWNGVPQDLLSFRREGTQRPVFDGSRVTGTTRYWMNSAGGPRLDVRELTVRNYRTGALRLDTDGNTVRNMIFERIGNKYVPDGPGYAAVHLLGSSGNAIVNNIMRNLENTDCPGCVHGVYAANESSRNLLQGNTFSKVTGDPVRLRNGTDDNIVEANTFTTSGLPGTDRALITFWRFTADEVCGTGNRADGNTYDGRFHTGAAGQRVIGSGAEDGLARCATALTGSGNVLG
ncbi:right-handed parallel beta-helix repeat-containing protein [Phytomonospora sp. NPDC050363]|uniref:right-handed parallel beta-helix repeat-containing protein n=1 Tax=Phytomonospora sp. NPDC050363 TaxID=3155642 RepID=UPI0033F8D57A